MLHLYIFNNMNNNHIMIFMDTSNPAVGDFRPCFVGDRIINSQVITLADGSTWCTKNSSGPLYQLYCGATNDSDTSDCDYFMKSAVETKPGIPGLASGVITSKS